MHGAVKGMRHGDSELKNRKTSTAASLEKEKKKNGLNHANDEKEKKMWNGVRMIQNSEVSATSCEEERKKEKLNKTNSKRKMMADDQEKEEMIIWNGHNKVKSRKVSTAFLEKERNKEKLCNTNSEKKMQSDDDEEVRNMCNCDNKLKNREESATLFEKEKRKEKLNKTHREEKMRTDDQNRVKSGPVSTAFVEMEKKRKRLNNTNIEKLQSDDDEDWMWNCDSKVKNGKVSTTFSEKEKKKKGPNYTNSEEIVPITSGDKEKKMRPSESMAMKKVHDSKQKRRNVPSDISKEKKMDMSNGSYYKKRKREEEEGEEPHALFKKEKKMQCNDGDKKIHSGRAKEKKVCSNGKEKRKVPSTFFKFICNNFEEFLFIPPTVADRLEDLTNDHVYLEDSEGKCSKVRLSVVDGSLALHQGWNAFVSDHLIKWGEFLVFEYTAKKTFYVRVFGRDSRERLNFSDESKRKGVRKKQTHSTRSPDNLVSFDGNSEDIYGGHYISGKYPRSEEPETHHVTVETKEGPKRVKIGVGSGTVVRDNKDGNLVNRQCKTKGTSPLCSKQKTVILITDSEPSTQENEDTVKLTTSDADSDKHHVTVNTNEDPKSQNGVGNGPSVVLGDKEESLPNGECGTKYISLTCSKGKTRGSGITVITDVDPSTHENGDRGKLTTYAQHKEDRSMIIEPEPEVAAPTEYIELELHDSDNHFRRKQEMNSVHLESTTVLDKYHNNSNVNGTVWRKYEVPGGFRCLEKWRKGIVSGQAALDGTGMMKPENPQKTDSKSVGDYCAIGPNSVNKCFCSRGTHACAQPILTMPVKKPSSIDRVYKYGHGDILEKKYGHWETEIDHSINGKAGGAAVQPQTKKKQLEPIGSIVNSQRNNIPASVNPVVSGNSGARGLNPVVSEGTYGFVKSVLTVPIEKPSSPDWISKCGSSRTVMDHNVYGKGTSIQLEIKMDQLEPVGSIVNSLSSNSIVHANHVGSCQSEHWKSLNSMIPVSESLLPMKTEVLELIDRSLLKTNLQFCIPNTTLKWLELPKSLSSAVRQKRQDRNVIMLKDPMKRLWPVLYHENSIFVGFTAGWNQFVAANNLQTGDLCELFKEPDDEEPVYSLQIVKK